MAVSLSLPTTLWKQAFCAFGTRKSQKSQAQAIDVERRIIDGAKKRWVLTAFCQSLLNTELERPEGEVSMKSSKSPIAFNHVPHERAIEAARSL